MRKKKTKTKQILLVIWIAFAVAVSAFVLTHSSTRMIERSIRMLTKIYILVAAASFIGAVLEYKAWTRFVHFLAAPLTHLGKLPPVAGAAFITAALSNNAANTLVAGSYRDGNISRREMFISGLCNSFPAMVSHSLRIFFPIFGLVGMAAVWYYSFTFGIGLAMTLVFLLISRFLAEREKAAIQNGGHESAETDQAEKEKDEAAPERPWSEVLTKSSRRAGKALWRIFIVTTPVYLLVGYMSKHHMFDFWKDLIPRGARHFMTPDMMTVLSARLGGLTAASSAASEYLHSGTLEVWQVVAAFLIGNIITNPIRTLRRNLPTATGIFPGKDGVWIVLILQGVRLIAAAIAVFAIFAVFK